MAAVTHLPEPEPEVEIETLPRGAWLRELVALEVTHVKVTQELIVEAARAPESALHRIIFRAADDEAAYRHRLNLAGRLLRRKIVLTMSGGETIHIRPFLHTGDKGYQSTATVMSRKNLRDEVLGRMRSDIEMMTNRYEKYAAIPEVASGVKMLRRWLKEHGG